jgi:hypothetical protein
MPNLSLGGLYPLPSCSLPVSKLVPNSAGGDCLHVDSTLYLPVPQFRSEVSLSDVPEGAVLGDRYVQTQSSLKYGTYGSG